MKITIPYLAPNRKSVVASEYDLWWEFNQLVIEESEWEQVKHLPIEQILERQTEGDEE